MASDWTEKVVAVCAFKGEAIEDVTARAFKVAPRDWRHSVRIAFAHDDDELGRAMMQVDCRLVIIFKTPWMPDHRARELAVRALDMGE